MKISLGQRMLRVMKKLSHAQPGILSTVGYRDRDNNRLRMTEGQNQNIESKFIAFCYPISHA